MVCMWFVCGNFDVFRKFAVVLSGGLMSFLSVNSTFKMHI